MLSTKEAAGRLGVTDARVRQLIGEGKLPAARLGARSWVIQEKDVTSYLYARVEERIEDTAALQPHRDFILADWPEGDEHWLWALTAPVSKIVDWAESAGEE